MPLFLFLIIELPKLNLPDVGLAIKERAGEFYVFDPVRKKEVLLQPEEYVRQALVLYLQKHLGYSLTRMACEKSLYVGSKLYRFDLMVYGNNQEPIMLCEFKAPNVPIDQTVFDQAARYNFELNLAYFFISNGLQHFACKIDHENKQYELLEEIPAYDQLIFSN